MPFPGRRGHGVQVVEGTPVPQGAPRDAFSEVRAQRRVHHLQVGEVAFRTQIIPSLLVRKALADPLLGSGQPGPDERTLQPVRLFGVEPDVVVIDLGQQPPIPRDAAAQCLGQTDQAGGHAQFLHQLVQQRQLDGQRPVRIQPQDVEGDLR